MGLFSKKPSIPQQILSKETFNYLVVAALQEELQEFCNLSSKMVKGPAKEGGAIEYIFLNGKKEVKILTYSCNTMGMAYNAASLMRIIMLHQPLYTFFIGTCAGLYPDKQKAGDVLVPHNIYSYESGKHTGEGKFEADHVSFDTDEDLRKYAHTVKNKVSKQYAVITDEHFCSGAAIIDNAAKRDEIKSIAPRKVSGLDMEAYSIACINNILKVEGKKLSVIKGIMDFCENKAGSEKAENKKLAISNSAKFTKELIMYIDEHIMGPKQGIQIFSAP